MREHEDAFAEADMWDLGPSIDALPRELEPGDLLEERTVRALREAGLLGRRRVIPRAWLAGAVAASLALFASGLAVGQWLGSRSATEMMVARQSADLQETAETVRRAGNAYVQALSALAESGQPRTSADALYARETALTTLHQAANQMVRISPNDPVAANILQGLDQANVRPPERRNTRRVIWF
ncbi:MAG TPA: hypothetical protein VF035_04930 [Longimicrobiales bacterium]